MLLRGQLKKHTAKQYIYKKILKQAAYKKNKKALKQVAKKEV